jgi:hypothetical protein
MRIFGRDQGETEDQPANILTYVRRGAGSPCQRRGLNADIGRKDFFEMAAIGFKIMVLARPEGEGCIVNTPPTDNVVQNLYIEAYTNFS